MGLSMGHFEAGSRRHSRTISPPRNDPAGTGFPAQPDWAVASCLSVASTTETPMTKQNQNPGQQNQAPGQQNQNPGQKPGQQQGGGQKPGQQQQDPSRPDQKPNPDQRAGH